MFLICHDLSKVSKLQDTLINEIEIGKISHDNLNQSLNRIMKTKKKLPGFMENEMNLEQILEENKKLVKEMRTHLV